MTGNKLLSITLDLLGLNNESGEAPNDLNDYTQRALSLINILLAENSILNARITKTEHSVIKINSLDDKIEMSDIILNEVLPYGLALLFTLGDDDSLAQSFNTLYTTGKKLALTYGKARIEPIKEVYQ